MLKPGTTILGWANYTQGLPRVIVRSLPGEGYLWHYLGEDRILRDGPKLDPFFRLPAWRIVETTQEQSTIEKQNQIIDVQSKQIVDLIAANEKLSKQVEALKARLSGMGAA